jgi:lysophospholipase L1-like esterase
MLGICYRYHHVGVGSSQVGSMAGCRRLAAALLTVGWLPSPELGSCATSPVHSPAPLAQSTEPAGDQPVERHDRNSQLAHVQLLQKARAGGISLYFLGDSITRRWGAADAQYAQLYANWTRNFFGWNAANFGWGGDETQNILWRLTNGELDGVNPKVIVLLAGTNNLTAPALHGDDSAKESSVIRGIAAILAVCRQKAPQATIVLMGVTPRNDDMALVPVINRINSAIARFADGGTIRYLNINDRLADHEGKLHDGMVNKDGLHLAVKGYQVWAEALRPVLTELLGPPAKQDTAPPPTGDPSQLPAH